MDNNFKELNQLSRGIQHSDKGGTPRRQTRTDEAKQESNDRSEVNNSTLSSGNVNSTITMPYNVNSHVTHPIS